jgi:hypothetical protein
VGASSTGLARLKRLQQIKDEIMRRARGEAPNSGLPNNALLGEEARALEAAEEQEKSAGTAEGIVNWGRSIPFRPAIGPEGALSFHSLAEGALGATPPVDRPAVKPSPKQPVKLGDEATVAAQPQPSQKGAAEPQTGNPAKTDRGVVPGVDEQGGSGRGVGPLRERAASMGEKLGFRDPAELPKSTDVDPSTRRFDAKGNPLYTNADLARVRENGPSRGGFMQVTDTSDPLTLMRAMPVADMQAKLAQMKLMAADPTGMQTDAARSGWADKMIEDHQGKVGALRAAHAERLKAASVELKAQVDAGQISEAQAQEQLAELSQSGQSAIQEAESRLERRLALLQAVRSGRGLPGQYFDQGQQY